MISVTSALLASFRGLRAFFGWSQGSFRQVSWRSSNFLRSVLRRSPGIFGDFLEISRGGFQEVFKRIPEVSKQSRGGRSRGGLRGVFRRYTKGFRELRTFSEQFPDSLRDLSGQSLVGLRDFSESPPRFPWEVSGQSTDVFLEVDLIVKASWRLFQLISG